MVALIWKKKKRVTANYLQSRNDSHKKGLQKPNILGELDKPGPIQKVISHFLTCFLNTS